MRRTIGERLQTALFHLDYLERYAAMDLTQSVVIDAVALRLAAAIDALGQLPDGELAALFGDTWPAMRGIRNRIAHGYHVVDAADEASLQSWGASCRRGVRRLP